MHKVDINSEPSSTVKKVLNSIDPTVELLDGEFDGDSYNYKFESSAAKRTTQRFSKEHLSDIFGKPNAHLFVKLEQKLRDAINRIK
jgi:hypothetical protein